MIKHFARLVTATELSTKQIQQFVETVSSIIDTKVVWTEINGQREGVEYLVYQDDEEASWVYEIVLQDDIDVDEGDTIAEALEDFINEDFDFEISTDTENG